MIAAVRAGLTRLLPKPPAGPLPLGLPRRRIYILPSRFGLVYALALFFLQLGALNYNNNAAILLALLLASIALLSAVTTVRFLQTLSVVEFNAEEAFAGSTQRCRLVIRSGHGPIRGELRVRVDAIDADISCHDDTATASWTVAAGSRGRHRLGTVRISTGYPLGMFNAWCVLVPESDRLVYPAPETPAAPWPRSDDPSEGQDTAQRAGDEEWHALREFRRGDSLRDIAWKTSARHDRWLVAETRSPSQSPTLRFALDHVAHLEGEQALSRLCRWVLAADAAHQSWLLELGDRVIGPGHGDAQRRQALSALAELP
jgi:uncharacterized protein (DUF58 family)